MGVSTNPTESSALADALFPTLRQRVLAVLFGTGAVQRELAGWTEAGLLTVRKQGIQKHYQPNASAPVFAELRRMGYRAGNRYIVFQVLPHTLGLGPEMWRVLDKCHRGSI